MAVYNNLIDFRQDIRRRVARTHDNFEIMLRLCEENMRNGLVAKGSDAPPVRVKEMIVKTNILVGDEGMFELPADMITPYSLTALSGERRISISYIDPQNFDKYARGAGIFYTEIDGRIRIANDYLGEVELLYYKEIEPLSELNETTHNIFTNYSQLYLYGVLYLAYEQERASQEQAENYLKYMASVHAANKLTRVGRSQGGNLSIRLSGVV